MIAWPLFITGVLMFVYGLGCPLIIGGRLWASIGGVISGVGSAAVIGAIWFGALHEGWFA